MILLFKRIFAFAKIYWFLAAIFYFYQYLLRVSAGVMIEDLMHDFSITATTIGSVIGLSSISYVIMQMPAGALTDYFGVKKLLVISIAICAFGAYLFSAAESMWLLMLSRILLGVGSAFAFVGVTKIISMYFPKNRMAFLVSLTIFVGSAGGVVGNGPLAYLVNEIGWREAMLFVAIGGFILSFFMLVMGWRQKEVVNANVRAARQLGLLDGIKHCLKTKPILLIAAWGFCIYMPICVFADAWGVPYIMKVYDLSRPHAASHVSIVYIGILFGSLFYGWLATIYQNYRRIFMASTSALFFLFLAILWAPQEIRWIMDILFFGIGWLVSVNLLMFPAAAQYAPVEMTASVVGVVNTTTMISGAIFQKVVGLLIDSLWDGGVCNGVPVYTAYCYQRPLNIILGMILLGTVIAYFMPKYKKDL